MMITSKSNLVKVLLTAFSMLLLSSGSLCAQSNNQGQYVYADGLKFCIEQAASSSSKGKVSVGCNDLSQCVTDADGCVVVPEVVSATFNGVTYSYDVTAVSVQGFQGFSAMKCITLPSSVTVIGNFAFSGCSGLTKFSVPEKLTTVGQCAFSGCSSITSLHFYDDIKTVDDRAFENCTSLTSIVFPENSITKLPQNLIAGCTNLKSFKIPSSVTLAEHASLANSGIEEITVPGDLTVNGQICNGCQNLKRVVFGEGVTKIKDNHFQGFMPGNLTEIVIPTSVTEIENYAFRGCYNLVRFVNLGMDPNAVTLGDNAFFDIPNTAELYVPREAVEAYKSSKWSTLKFGTHINEYHFKIGCITYAVLNSNEGDRRVAVNSVDPDCAVGDLNIPHSVSLAESSYDVTEIDPNAFVGCDKVTSVTIGKNVNKVSGSAFCDMPNLASVSVDHANAHIYMHGNLLIRKSDAANSDVVMTAMPYATMFAVPESVGSFAQLVFNCAPDVAVGECYMSHVPAYDKSVANCSFRGLSSSPKPMLNVNKDMVAAFTAAGYTNYFLLNGVVAAGSRFVVDGIEYEIVDPVNHVVEVVGTTADLCKKSNTAAIGPTVIYDAVTYKVTAVRPNAFQAASCITGLTIGAGVVNIGDNAFSGCVNLEAVKLGKDVVLGKGVFCGAEKIAKFEVDKSNANYATANDSVLYSKDLSTIVAFPGAKETYILPNYVTTVAADAFCSAISLRMVFAKGNVAPDVYGDNWASGIPTGAAKPQLYVPNAAAADDFCGSEMAGHFNVRPLTFAKDGITYRVNSANAATLTLVSADASVTGAITIGSASYGCSPAMTVTKIGDYAFASCDKVTKITLGTAVTAIGTDAFCGTDALTAIEVNNSAFKSVNGLLCNAAATSLLHYPAAKSGKIAIPSSVTDIAPNAFCGRVIEDGEKMVLTFGAPLKADNKVYDGTTNYNGTITLPALNGLHSAHEGEVSVKVISKQLNRSDAGAATLTVTVALDGTAAAFYTLDKTQYSVSIQITKKELTLNDDAEIYPTHFYDGTKTPAHKKSPSLDGLIEADKNDVRVTLRDATLAQAEVAPSVSVTLVYTLTSPNGKHNNYVLKNNTLTRFCTIAQRTAQLSGSVQALGNKVYDGVRAIDNPQDLFSVPTISNKVTINGVVDNVEVRVKSAILDDANVGNRTATVTLELVGSRSANYALAQAEVQVPVTVVPMPLTVSGTPTIDNVTYGCSYVIAKDKVRLTGMTLSGIVPGEENVVVLDVDKAELLALGAGSRIATVKVKLAGTGAGNYTLANDTYNDVPVMVVKAKLRAPLTLTTFAARDYDGTTNVIDDIISVPKPLGVQCGDDVSLKVISAQLVTPDAGAQKDVTVLFELDGAAKDNYELLEPDNRQTSYMEVRKRKVSFACGTVKARPYDGTTNIYEWQVIEDLPDIVNIVEGDKGKVIAKFSAGSVASAEGGDYTAILYFRLVEPKSGTWAAEWDEANAMEAKNYELTTLHGRIECHTTIKGNAVALDPTSVTVPVREYDGTRGVDKALVGKPTLIGVKEGDDVDVELVKAELDDIHAGDRRAILTYRLIGAQSDVYTFATEEPDGTSFISVKTAVTRRHVTLVGGSVPPRKYDGSPNVHLVTNPTVQGLLDCDTTMVYLRRDSVGMDGYAVGTHTVTIKYSLQRRLDVNEDRAVNYHLDPDSIQLQCEILPDIWDITLDANATVRDREYDGTTNVDTLTVRKPTFKGLRDFDADYVDIRLVSAELDNPNVGNNHVVTLTYELVGERKDNYALPNPVVKVEGVRVLRRVITLNPDAVVVPSRPYDGTKDVPVATVELAPNLLTNVIEGDDIRVILTNGILDKPDIGIREATLYFKMDSASADVGNYRLMPTILDGVPTEITEGGNNGKPVTINGVMTVLGKVYDGLATLPKENVILPETLVGVDPADVGKVSLVIDKVTLDAPDAGPRTASVKVRLVGSKAGDYSLPMSVFLANVIVDPKPVELNGSVTIKSRKENGSRIVEPELVVLPSLSGAVAGDDVAAAVLSATLDNAICGHRHVTVVLTLAGDDAHNYILENTQVEAPMQVLGTYQSPDDPEKPYVEGNVIVACDEMLVYSCDGHLVGSGIEVHIAKPGLYICVIGRFATRVIVQ